MKHKTLVNQDCAHCQQPITEPVMGADGDKLYCCYGCKVVDELLHGSGNRLSGTDLKTGRYAYLDEPKIRKGLLHFEDEGHASINLHLPQIHCSSCIYLLENLRDLDEGILDVKVHFSKKEAHIAFRSDVIKLSQLAALLDYIGYAPDFQTRLQAGKSRRNTLLIQLGVAGFFFGNTMLLALPEYLHGSLSEDANLQLFFRYLMMAFSLPVISYSGRDYFVNAAKALRAGVLGIDLPIALGIAVLFLRSSYEVISGVGTGYFDSLNGLVFFLLIGKWYQQKTYENFTFDRDFRSFLPLAANLLLKNGKEKPIAVEDIEAGDLIVVRQGEVVPADARLESPAIDADYSYITGESLPVSKKQGDTIFAGARIKGKAARLLVTAGVDQSYLSSLWGREVFQENIRKSDHALTDKISQYFTPAILLIATLATLGWSFIDIEKGLSVFAAVLIVACPCALALAEPFAAGSMMRWFGRHGFFLKNSKVLNRLATVSHIVFDKTGTLTKQEGIEIKWQGCSLSDDDKKSLATIVSNAQHPLARPLLNYLAVSAYRDAPLFFSESTGEGVVAELNGDYFRLGKASFLSITGDQAPTTAVYLEKNDQVLGYFSFYQQTREQTSSVLRQLEKHYQASLLSGDNEAERQRFAVIFGSKAQLRFNQSPHQKLAYLEQLQSENERVLMIGDGLNDAGALQQSEVGISLCERQVNFFPASDGLLQADAFGKLPAFMALSQLNRRVIYLAFGLSLLYNLLGLSFAVAGILSPLVCAVLMPLSSVSVVIFTTLSNRYLCKRALSTPGEAAAVKTH